MTSGRNEVEQRMNTVVPEPWVTPDPGLLCKNVIVLALEIADNLLEAVTRKRVLTGFH